MAFFLPADMWLLRNAPFNAIGHVAAPGLVRAEEGGRG